MIEVIEQICEFRITEFSIRFFVICTLCHSSDVESGVANEWFSRYGGFQKNDLQCMIIYSRVLQVFENIVRCRRNLFDYERASNARERKQSFHGYRKNVLCTRVYLQYNTLKIIITSFLYSEINVAVYNITFECILNNSKFCALMDFVNGQEINFYHS